MQVLEPVQLSHLFTILDQAIHPEGARAVLVKPEAALVQHSAELIVAHAAAEKTPLSDRMWMTLAAFLGQGEEMLAKEGVSRTHPVFSRAP